MTTDQRFVEEAARTVYEFARVVVPQLLNQQELNCLKDLIAAALSSAEQRGFERALREAGDGTVSRRLGLVCDAAIELGLVSVNQSTPAPEWALIRYAKNAAALAASAERKSNE